METGLGDILGVTETQRTFDASERIVSEIAENIVTISGIPEAESTIERAYTYDCP
jgi:hypothetical protein